MRRPLTDWKCDVLAGDSWKRRFLSQMTHDDDGMWWCADAALSVSLEAEATSAVIAAQALAPVQSCQISPAPSSSTATDDVHLHCGCRWSPSTSQSTVVDVEPTSLPTSFYHAHSPALPNLQTGALHVLCVTIHPVMLTRTWPSRPRTRTRTRSIIINTELN